MFFWRHFGAISRYVFGAHAFPADSKLIRSKDQIEDIAAGTGTHLAGVFASRSEAGRTLDEAIQIITDEMSAQYADRSRLAGAILAGYAEAG